MFFSAVGYAAEKNSCFVQKRIIKMIKKIIVCLLCFGFAAAYCVSPVDAFPGPVDDIIMSMAMALIGSRQLKLKKSENDNEENDNE